MAAESFSNEQYIIDESQEINLGESLLLRKFFRAFPALKYRNYQLYFTGQLVSFIGTWMQTVAQSWLVLQLTHSAFWVGAISALGSIPILFFGLFSGVIIDRFSKRGIIIAAESAMMLFSFILGALTINHSITLFEIALLSFLTGAASALDMPARQAFSVEMVGKNDLSSAIALNSGIFNGARVVGPSIAGFAIALIGTGGAFI